MQTNQVTLHTGSTCSISASSMTGSISTDNCDVSGGDNTGCGVTTTNDATYGSTFNDNGGGVYATLLTTSGIVVWFWSHSSVPGDVLGSSPDPSSWSTPLANFTGACDFGTAFAAQQLVFDTTFCGDWAGDVWSQGGCASKAATCEDYVANNGADFSEAYWSINALKVFQAQSSSQTSASPPSLQVSASTPATVPSSTSDLTSSTTPTLSAAPVPQTSDSTSSTIPPLSTAPVLPTSPANIPTSTSLAVTSPSATLAVPSAPTTLETSVISNSRFQNGESPLHKPNL